jgi:hypothetical protein
MSEWISGWIEELSSPKENKLALCPFAKKAWDNNEVKVVKSQNLWESVHKEVSEFGQYKVVLCIQPTPEQDYLELETACSALNNWFAFEEQDIWLLASEMHGENIVFVQKRSELNVASRSLEKLGYYVDYNKEDFERLIDRRRHLGER